MTVCATAKRRRRQATQGYPQYHPMRRPRLKKTDESKARARDQAQKLRRARMESGGAK